MTKEILIKRIERNDNGKVTIAISIIVRDRDKIIGKIIPLLSYSI